jgi:hypothetical protein
MGKSVTRRCNSIFEQFFSAPKIDRASLKKISGGRKRSSDPSDGTSLGDP